MAISRNQFDETKNWTEPQWQEGVPVMDADLNLAVKIDKSNLRRAICDFIGNGSPNYGFKLSGLVTNPTIHAGNIWVAGLKIELPTDILTAAQPNAPVTFPSGDGIWYLDVVEQLLTNIHDPVIRDSRLPSNVETPIKVWKTDWTLRKVLDMQLSAPEADHYLIGIASETAGALSDIRNSGMIFAGADTGFQNRTGTRPGGGHRHNDEDIDVQNPNYTGDTLDEVLSEIDSRIDSVGGSVVNDHGTLGGLGDDDHVQYLNTSRHSSVHTANFNNSLPVSGDIGGAATLGAHISNNGIHGAGTWKAPVQALGNLPATGNTDKDARLVEDENAIYRWDSGTSAWYKTGNAGTGVTDHGALTGLEDDDHTQYLTAARHLSEHPASVNLLPNGGFEQYLNVGVVTSIPGWMYVQSGNPNPVLTVRTVTYNPETNIHGIASISVSTNSAPGVFAYFYSQFIPIGELCEYTASAYFACIDFPVSNVALRIRFFANNYSLIGDPVWSASSLINNTEFVRKTVSAEAPANATYALVDLVFGSSIGGNGTLLIDSAMLNPGSAASPYVEPVARTISQLISHSHSELSGINGDGDIHLSATQVSAIGKIYISGDDTAPATLVGSIGGTDGISQVVYNEGGDEQLGFYLTPNGHGNDKHNTAYLNSSAHSSTNHAGIQGVGVSDHGALTGLGDDDHTLYLTPARHNDSAHSAINHHALTGLGDDDHTQYLNSARHNALDHPAYLIFFGHAFGSGWGDFPGMNVTVPANQSPNRIIIHLSGHMNATRDNSVILALTINSVSQYPGNRYLMSVLGNVTENIGVSTSGCIVIYLTAGVDYNPAVNNNFGCQLIGLGTITNVRMIVEGN